MVFALQDDCGDKSDEGASMCASFKSKQHCPREMFFCNDTAKSCIPERWKCDSKSDCPNGNDEDPKICNVDIESTPTTPFCVNGYACQNTTSKNAKVCLNWSQVCDSRIDCPGM